MSKICTSLFLCTLLLCSCSSSPSPVPQTSSGFAISSKPPDPTAGWQTYANATYWLEMKVPRDFKISELGPNAEAKSLAAGKRPSGKVLPTLDTIVFTGSGRTLTLTMYRGVEGNMSIADIGLDGKCGTPLSDVIVTNIVFLLHGYRFHEIRQQTGGKETVDECFLNRQRYVLTLRAADLDPAKADQMHALMLLILKTLQLHRG